MPKRSLTVLYGQPSYLSTSLQTKRLAKALEDNIEVHQIPIKSQTNSPWRTHSQRLWQNYAVPLVTRPKTDYVLYGNDGFADLSHWSGTKIVYWYDAPADWSRRPPHLRDCVSKLRYKNIKVADLVFAVSHAQVKVARALRPGRENSVRYLPVGTDCSLFDPERASAKSVREQYRLPDKPIIGYLGYLGLVNGRFAGECLAEIAPKLVASSNVHFLIVGFGPALANFRESVLQLGVEKNFTFTGRIEEDLLPDYLASMDVCVDTLEPGFHSEARSETKLKQYMAMGRACVATAIGENCIDLNHGECGVLVEPGNEYLLRGIELLCSKPGLRIELGKAARNRALEIYDWKRLAARMIEALVSNGA